MKNLTSMLLSVMSIVAINATEQTQNVESVKKAQSLGVQVQKDIESLRPVAEKLKTDPSSNEAKEQGTTGLQKVKSDFQQFEQAAGEVQKSVGSQQNTNQPQQPANQ